MSLINTKLVVVAGATGNQGGAVAGQLLGKGYVVRALTRNPDSGAARELAHMGAIITKCDLNDRFSVEEALKGAWGAFGVFTMAEGGVRMEEEQGKHFAEAAYKAGVQHYVYSSVASAYRHTGIPHFENKWRVEHTVRSLGFPSYAIIRPAYFMENFTSPWFLPGLERGKLMVALRPDTRLQMIAVEDIGRFGLMAFEKYQDLNRAEIDVAGDEKTMPEVAEILSAELGRKIDFAQIPLEDMRKRSTELAAMYEWLDTVGMSIDIPGLRERYGVKTLTFKQWAAKVKWSAPVHR